MSLAGIHRIRIQASWLMALVLTVTLLFCHMALGQVHQMAVGHDSMVSSTHIASQGTGEIPTNSLAAADSFAISLIAVLGMLALSRTRSFRARRFAAYPLRLPGTGALYVAPRPCCQRAGPAFSGVFRL